MRADNLIQLHGSTLGQPPSMHGVGGMRGLMERAALWLERAKGRRELRALLENDQRFFDDIGVSRAVVYNESRKWFWED